MKKATQNAQKVAQNTKQSKSKATQSKATAKQSKEKTTSPKFTPFVSGVDGKGFQSLKIKANNLHKSDFGSYMKCLKRAVHFMQEAKDENGKTAFDYLAYVVPNDFEANSRPIPVNLIQFLTTSEKERVNNADKNLYPNGKFSVWLLMQLITRYNKSEAEKQLIKK